MSKYVNKNNEVYEGEMDLNVLRHTASHIMAQAIKRLYPQAKLAIGPFIENGFYYDIDMEKLKIPSKVTYEGKEYTVS